MQTTDLLRLICHSAAFICGFVLFFGPFTKKGRSASHWMRVALWLSGLSFVVWGGFGLKLQFGSLSPGQHSQLLYLKSVLGGIGVGILLLLFLSGEFVKTF